MRERPDPFRIVVPATAPRRRRAALVVARPLLSRVLALPTLRRLYDIAASLSADAFCARALRVLNVTVAFDEAEAAMMPAGGPLIVASNHPHGAIDGLVLADVLRRTRDDVRVVTNHLLAQIPELSEMCFFVDAFGGRSTRWRTTAGLRAAVKWLQQGHALVVFPAGEVAHAFVGGSSTPVDSPWRETVGRLALQTGAHIVPAFIEGQNSAWFYRAGRVHPAFRTLLLARELLRQRGRRIVVRLGQPMMFTRQVEERSVTRVTAAMRAAVDRLGSRSHAPAHPASPPVIDRGSVTAFASDVRALGSDSRLLRNGRFEVFVARAAQIPNVLCEIGRLRELTFRAVGEGTGTAVDLDRFDEHYEHLFIWNQDTREVVGAYRIGAVDEIVAARGVNGLYTSTLFRYDHRLLTRLGTALELGRSFVRADYQRSNALLLLWKGIAQYVVRARRYRVLFGPVSISRRYADTSQQLLRAFLAQNSCHGELAELVAARTPPPPLRDAGEGHPRMSADLRELDKLIAGQEPDGKGVPVLLRQYLRLNAKLLGFNIDPAFGDALDALMMVDLGDVDPAILTKYFGAREAASLSHASPQSLRSTAA